MIDAGATKPAARSERLRLRLPLFQAILPIALVALLLGFAAVDGRVLCRAISSTFFSRRAISRSSPWRRRSLS